MAKIDLSAPPAFGYVGPKVNADKAGRAVGKKHQTLQKIADNGLKIAGYIPIIGFVPGVVRIARALFSEYKPSSPKLSLPGHIFRGGVELIGLGGVFLPVDLVSTVYRRFFKGPALAETQETNDRPAEEEVSSDHAVPESGGRVSADPPLVSQDETSEENAPLTPEITSLSLSGVNEPPPPVLEKIFLEVYRAGHSKMIRAENVRLGPHFQKNIYNAILKAYPTYQGQTQQVIFDGKEVDKEGMINGKFPDFCHGCAVVICHVNQAKGVKSRVILSRM